MVEPGDRAGLISKAVRLLDDPAQREELGGRARQYAEENFDVSVVADRFEPILDPLARAGHKQIEHAKAR